MDRNPDDHKFEELILLICRWAEADPTLGAVKLHKLLFYSDFVAYRQLGSAITWQRYQRLPKGPCARQLLPTIDRLQERGEVAKAERTHHGLPQHRTIALREPDMSVFSSSEVGVVHDVITEHWGRTATEMSKLSHLFIGWRLADEREDIPYESMLVPDDGHARRELDPELVDRINARAQELVGGAES